MTRLWADGTPINVVSDGHYDPRAFTWQGRRHGVTAVTRRWRVDVDWWRRRVWRAYYKVSTDSGLLVEVYQDLLTGQWYLQRMYD